VKVRLTLAIPLPLAVVVVAGPANDDPPQLPMLLTLTVVPGV
jgi:hypothetical protein